MHHLLFFMAAHNMVKSGLGPLQNNHKKTEWIDGKNQKQKQFHITV